MNMLKIVTLIIFLNISISVGLNASSNNQPCIYGVTDCGSNAQCVFIDLTKSECMALPGSIPSIRFPLKSKHKFFCDQGNLSPPENSHIYKNTAFAIDLVSDRKHPPAKIVSVSQGTVIAYSKCTKHNDQCGDGFGNSVKVLANDGFLYFYAHLEKIFVKTGSVVSEGQIIGIEGNTGLTGENHRHLHFSVHYNWRDIGFQNLENNIGQLPPSVPFFIRELKKDSRQISCKRTSGKTEWLNWF